MSFKKKKKKKKISSTPVRAKVDEHLQRLYPLPPPPSPPQPCMCVCSVVQSCLTLCNPMPCSLPGRSVHRISQPRILEWVAISLPGDLPKPGIEPVSPVLAGGFYTTVPPWKPPA